MNGFECDQPAVTSLRETRLVEDIDAMDAVVRDDLRADFVQLDSTRFWGRWTTGQVGDIAVQFGSLETRVACHLRVPASRWAFIVPLDASLAMRWNGYEVRPWQILVCPPEGEWLAFHPPSSRFAILTAGSGSTPAHAARLLFASTVTAPFFAGCGVRGLLLAERLIALRDAMETGAWRRGDLRDCLDTVDDFGAHLAGCLRLAVGSCSQPTAGAASNQVVARVEAYLQRHLDTDVSMSTFAVVAGVSERRVRDAFYEVYATSPKRYFKLRRLHKVHHALESGGGGGLTVTEAAIDYGFGELGRFAGEYRAMFGEVPSRTLNRARASVRGGPGARWRSAA